MYTSTISLTLSFLGFTLILCFFALSNISTEYTYFERYQDDWDIMVTLKDTEIETFGLSGQLRSLKGVRDLIVYQKSEAFCSVSEGNQSPELAAIGGLSAVTGQQGPWTVKAPIVVLDDAGFTAYSGEILGIAGIAGSGQKELLEAIAGLQPMEDGTIRYYPPEGGEETLSGMSPAAIRKLGIKLSFVPEDRLGMGLVAAMGMTDNMMLRGYKKGIPFFTDRRTPKAMAEQLIKELEIVTPGVSTPVGRLSGGNVQKVLVGREISSNPRVLMVAYPVRGLDINSSYTIYHLLNEQKKQGAAVICVGEDLDVLLELCDRILVLCGGKVSGIVDGRTATKEEIGLMMTKTGGEQDE